MKEKIHPKYELTTIRCACGNTVETRSTKKEITIDVCSACHPFFTGKQKLVDTAGRVDRFRKKFAAVAARKKKKASPETASKPEPPSSEAPAKKTEAS